MSSSRRIGHGIVDMEIDEADQTYAHAVETEASEIVSDDIDMQDADVEEALERVASLDSEGRLVGWGNDATDFDRVRVLMNVRGKRFIGSRLF
ncbi:hypothetical protein M378DRAFT_172978 [Amanita muscaria Koide BX008]|uniref:Uncharacterized protein n=1 Tax=Amanita muscaria (strain Koide BX008) TaxID=946122 RepID=A0A0C2W4S0_AMAMK|nr:hypothetical protein M378DRAFT_172978 [Amanita muscaria Koide BX008]